MLLIPSHLHFSRDNKLATSVYALHCLLICLQRMMLCFEALQSTKGALRVGKAQQSQSVVVMQQWSGNIDEGADIHGSPRHCSRGCHALEDIE